MKTQLGYLENNMKLDGLLIVEGNTDKAFISSLVDANILVTNGYSLKKEDIEFVKEVIKNKPVYVLTDPDEAGDKIREKIHSEIPGAVDIFIDKKYCDKNHKHGVAESTKQHLFEVLKPYLKNDEKSENKGVLPHFIEKITNFDKEKQKEICRIYHLGNVNLKTMCKRLNILEIQEKDLEKLWK